MSVAKFSAEIRAKSATVPFWQHPELHCTTDAGLQIRHGFFGARGGVSTGVYKSLNCGLGSHDDPDLITENRRRVAVKLGFAPNKLFGLRQIHSPDCIFIDDESDADNAARPEADAMVTKTANHALAILTADCVPVLFAAPSAGLVGAAHAGWRGAICGVLEATIAKMSDLGAVPQQIKAVIGPAIQQVNYQVGDDLRHLVLRAHPNAKGLFIYDEAGKYRFDLPGFVEMCLREAGLGQIHNLGIDTYGESSGLFSYRQTTHADLSDSGRQISVIGMLSEVNS